jgi:hypothetical protein
MMFNMKRRPILSVLLALAWLAPVCAPAQAASVQNSGRAALPRRQHRETHHPLSIARMARLPNSGIIGLRNSGRWTRQTGKPPSTIKFQHGEFFKLAGIAVF